MAKHKARELPGSIQHLPAYIPPAPDRISHRELWARALLRWKPGTRVWVEFPPEKKR